MTKLFGNKYRRQTIFNWIKITRAKALKRKHRQEPMESLEMDGLYTYVKNKDLKIQIWTTDIRDKKRINLVIGEVYDKF